MLDSPLLLQVKLSVDRIFHIVDSSTELFFYLEHLPLTQTTLAWAVCFPITEHLRARILKSIITWSEMKPQTTQAIVVYCPCLINHFQTQNVKYNHFKLQ